MRIGVYAHVRVRKLIFLVLNHATFTPLPGSFFPAKVS